MCRTGSLDWQVLAGSVGDLCSIPQVPLEQFLSEIVILVLYRNAAVW